MEEDIKKKINQVEDYLYDVGLDLEYARDELNRLYDTLEEKSNNNIKDINNFKRELKRDGLYSEKLEYSLGFKAPEDRWNYVYDKLIVGFILPETEIDYKVLSIWTTKTVEELKEGE